MGKMLNGSSHSSKLTRSKKMKVVDDGIDEIGNM